MKYGNRHGKQGEGDTSGVGAQTIESACRACVTPQESASVQREPVVCPDGEVQPAVAASTKRYVDSTHRRGPNGYIGVCEGTLHRGVCMPAYLVMCVCWVHGLHGRADKNCHQTCGAWHRGGG